MKTLQEHRQSSTSRREQIRRSIARNPPDFVSGDEVEAHFNCMPLRYWKTVSVDDVLWHLKTIRAFFRSLLMTEGGKVPIVRWRHFPNHHYSEVIVCTWDRHGLLANIAGTFAAVQLNILNANVYTRSDQVVLDIFEVADVQQQHVRKKSLLRRMAAILGHAFAEGGNLSFEELLRQTRKKASVGSSFHHHGTPPSVSWNNDRSEYYSLLRIETRDRLGLLYHVLRELSEAELGVRMAKIRTVRNRAIDEFHVTEKNGEKLLDKDRLEQVRQHLLPVLVNGD